jgi:6-phosphofructokinase 2
MGHLHVVAGGGGINVARVVRALGGVAIAIAAVGGFSGDELVLRLREEKIPVLPIPVRGMTRRNLTVVDGKSGEQYRFVGPGPELDEVSSRACVRALFSIEPRPSIVALSGSTPAGVPATIVEEVASAARELGARLVVDTSGPTLTHALQVRPTLLKPNLKELVTLLGTTDDPASIDVERAALALARKGVGLVVVSLGHRGAIAATEEGAVFRVRSPEVKVVSTVGAGDTMLGAMVLGLDRGLAPEEIVRCGVAAGTATVTQPEGALASGAMVQEMLPRITVERL